jgi:hypothetical protein
MEEVRRDDEGEEEKENEVVHGEIEFEEVESKEELDEDEYSKGGRSKKISVENPATRIVNEKVHFFSFDSYGGSLECLMTQQGTFC